MLSHKKIIIQHELNAIEDKIIMLNTKQFAIFFFKKNKYFLCSLVDYKIEAEIDL